MTDTIAHKKKWCWSAVAGLILSLLPIAALFPTLNYVKRTGLGGVPMLFFIYPIFAYIFLSMSVILCLSSVSKVNRKGAWLGIVGATISGVYGAWLGCFVLGAFARERVPALVMVAAMSVGLSLGWMAICNYISKRREAQQGCQAEAATAE